MSLPDLDIDALRAFVTVADAGGFTAAAERLGRTQSAISVKIKRLEDALGRRVFERTSRSFAVTRDGELLLGYARRLLELNDETVRRFAEPAAEGDLRLGVAEYFVPQHLATVLGRFAKVYPRVNVEVQVGMSSEMVAALDAGDLDLVIAKRENGERRGRMIWRDPLRWAAPVSFTLPDPSLPVPLCALRAPCMFRGLAIKALAETGRPWRLVYTSSSMIGVQAAVRAGLGVTVLGESSVVEGMRVLGPEEGLPELGEVEIAVFGETARNRRLAEPLVGFILDSLRALRPAAASAPADLPAEAEAA
ncbi:LysR substrate-binding domain-containing protein [Azospirillum thermophilum]|uniref:LysR family transcriptional regulator n=1 Tax=Azospirillum thermophilum TaxID=2202148 RepID=A0A2S2CPB1_9PROT|nr:LysR substrate-binding domain-containing protein [Azospirillum thermophilum]AWK86275.1 LysR family transcriptional regulator [Azospirillum thermophilum]